MGAGRLILGEDSEAADDAKMMQMQVSTSCDVLHVMSCESEKDVTDVLCHPAAIVSLCLSCRGARWAWAWVEMLQILMRRVFTSLKGTSSARLCLSDTQLVSNSLLVSAFLFSKRYTLCILSTCCIAETCCFCTDTPLWAPRPRETC